MTFALWHIVLASTGFFILGFFTAAIFSMTDGDHDEVSVFMAEQIQERDKTITELRRKAEEKEISRRLLTGEM